MAPAKPIAVGISDTAASNAALLWAAARAKRLKCPLAVVNVVDDRWMAAEVLPYLDVLRESGMGLLKEAGEKATAAEPGVHISLQLLEGGVGAALGDYSKNASMLVLGTSGHHRGALTDRALQAAAAAECPVAVRGKGGFERLFLGSTAHAVRTRPPCPTVITRMHSQLND